MAKKTGLTDTTFAMPAAMQALELFNQIKQFRQTEVTLPLSGLKVSMTPLVASEDLKLKTARVSMAKFQSLIDELLYEHSTFDIPFASLADFKNGITNSDREVLVYALLKATYDLFGNRTVYCENPDCGAEFEINLNPANFLKEDSIKAWDKPDTPAAYIKTFTYFNNALQFNVKLVNMTDQMEVLKLLSLNESKDNIKNAGRVLSKPQFVLTFVHSIIISTEENTITLKDKQTEIYPFLQNLDLSVLDQVIKDTSEEFKDFTISFYDMIECPECKHNFRYEIDISQEFFRKALSIS